MLRRRSAPLVRLTVLIALLSLARHGVGAASTPDPAAEAVALEAAAARDEGRLEEALALYRRALELNPQSPEHLWFVGATLYELARYDEAKTAFTRLLNREPDHAGAFGLRGLCSYHLGLHEEALRDLMESRTKGISRTPALAGTVRYHVGILLTLFGDYDVGHLVLSEFAAEGNESPAVIEALGLNLLRRSLLPGDLQPADRPLVRLAGRAAFLMATRRSAEARKVLDDLIDRHGGTSNVHYARGVFRLAEEPERAIEDFRRELEISPEHVSARLQLAFEHLRRGEVEAARPYAEQAVAIQPHYFAARLALGQVRFEAGRLDHAIAEFEAAVKLAPESAQTHFMLSRAYARAGRSTEAERERDEFVRLDTQARRQRTGPQSVGGAGVVPDRR